MAKNYSNESDKNTADKNAADRNSRNCYDKASQNKTGNAAQSVRNASEGAGKSKNASKSSYSKNARQEEQSEYSEY
ncbi:MAG: hypothetical protein ACI4EG_09180 [Fusicatenibacter sp.]|nr:hypothetical protein [Fusicatenibacter sp.]